MTLPCLGADHLKCGGGVAMVFLRDPTLFSTSSLNIQFFHTLSKGNNLILRSPCLVLEVSPHGLATMIFDKESYCEH